jgi:replicative DNA helicase
MHTNGKVNGNLINQFPSTVPDKLQPHDVEAEEAVLGALLIDPDAIIKVAPILAAADFFIHRHGWIYEAMRNLFERRCPIDVVTLVDELRKVGRLDEIGQEAAITSFINRTPSSMHVEWYAGIVKEKATRRRVMAVAGEMARMAFDLELLPEDLLAKSERMLLDATGDNTSKGPVFAGALVDKVFDHIDRVCQSKGITGLPTGLTDLDMLIGGFQNDDMIVIAGRPGMGKSALALQIVTYVAEKFGKRSLIFSIEMSDEQLTQRALSSKSGIEVTRLRTGQIQDTEWPRLLEAQKRISTLPFAIDDSSTITPQQMRAKAIRHHAKYGLDLVVVDYIQLMDSDLRGQNRHQEVADISRACKKLARELKIPVIVLSQLNRSVESQHDKRPTMAHLRESGAIEADADVILFIYRDEVYNSDTQYPGVAELIIGKHRSGPTGVVKVFFRSQFTEFVSLATNKVNLSQVA